MESIDIELQRRGGKKDRENRKRGGDEKRAIDQGSD